MYFLKFLFLFTLTTALFSNSSLFILGKSTNKILANKNSIAWTLNNDSWSVSQPINNINPSKYTNGYLLINNDQINYTLNSYKKEYYTLNKGWNYIASHKNGVDIEKSFKDNKNINFIYVYDKKSKAWAGYSPNKKLMNKIKTTRILILKYIEPSIGFFIHTKKSTKVKIKSTLIDKMCQKKLDNGYLTIVSSGINKNIIYNKEMTMGIKSRYSSHYRRGIYNDTRVLLIYPKIDNFSQKNLLKYGPGNPKTLLRYDKKYENKKFLIFDFYKKSCYMGIYPSLTTPPFSSLKKIK